MSVAIIVLLVLALIAFIVAAAGIPFPPRYNLIALGLAFWEAAQLVGAMR